MFKEILGKIATTVVEHQPVIATVVLVGSVIATGVIIYKESPKIHKAFEERKEEIDDIKKSDKMTEEEKEEEIDKVDKKTAKAVAPSFIKITIGTICVVSSVAFVNFTAAVATGTIATGYNIANEKIAAYKDVIKKEAPEKAEDIEAMVDRKVAEKMKKYDIDEIDPDAKPGNYMNAGEVEIFDEFGNTWFGTLPDCYDAVNCVNELINDGDDVLLNRYYGFIPRCKKTILGKSLKFPKWKGFITIKPTPEINPKTGKLIRIMIEYVGSPVFVSNKDMDKYKDRRKGNHGSEAREEVLGDGYY